MIWLWLTTMGCSGFTEVSTSVASIEELHLSVAGSQWTATLGDELMDFHPQPCPVLRADMVAHLDDLELEVVDPGSAVPAFDGGQACSPPRLAGEVPPRPGASRLVLRDELGTLTCEIPDLAGTRSVALVPPGPWELRAGQTVTLQWSPARDLQITFPYVLLRSATDSPSVNNMTAADGLLTFTIPAILPGTYQLEIHTRSRMSCRVSQADFDATISTSNVNQPVTIIR